ncbi:hypothetical protein EWM64_g10094 [Hericium alpestre]|uniref:Uncharacterized protein n=1 Tax=Hericium alpestre TaxID=135208 RepID=A0A4Y9ZJU2_9AGAM|nr:hypothetical protein EWM64_g10094 [Hericium alpestre]
MDAASFDFEDHESDEEHSPYERSDGDETSDVDDSEGEARTRDNGGSSDSLAAGTPGDSALAYDVEARAASDSLPLPNEGEAGADSIFWQKLPKSMNYRYYTFNQLCDLLGEKVEQHNELKLKTLNMDQKIVSLSMRLSDYKCIVTAVAMHDLPSVNRLIAVALRNSRGPREILSLIERACRALYHVKSFKKKDFDIAKMVLTLGGPKLLYGIHIALDLPNVNSVYNHAPSPKILPSLGKPTVIEIEDNMLVLSEAGFFWKSSIGSPAPRRGWSIMADNIALEERPCYNAPRNAVLGLCQEHALCCDLEVTSIEPLKGIQAALDNDKIHRAKEAMVAGMAPFASTNYSVAPVLLSGTCKKETAIEQRTMFTALIEAWYKPRADGEVSFATRYGDVWNIATDGDATYRASLHSLLMSRTLQSSSPIYRYLAPLRLMNMKCGEWDILADKDLKHKLKNFASHLRTAEGFLVLNSHIQPTLLRSVLSKELSMQSSVISGLFDLRDHQNVPKAVRLLTTIAKLSDSKGLSPLINSGLFVLGKLLGCLVEPYITPSMSLSQQLMSLATCTHLLFKLWHANGSSFCPGQLYYDIQSLIKNIFWDVAKQKVMGSEVGLYIGQRGSDRLETEFGNYRTMTHQQNMDIQQLADRAGAAADLSRIFADHPEMDCGHRRLRLEGSEGIDHTNPVSWTGDIIVGNVSLLTTWNAGRNKAIDILSKAGIADAAHAFHFPDSDIDMLCPEEGYVGLCESDEEIARDADIVALSSAAPVTSESETLGSKIDTIMLEDLIPESLGEDPDNIFSKEQVWLDVEGTSIHKASAVRILLGTNDGLKSTDRLRRVRGYSRNFNIKNSINEDSIAGNLFMVGQMVAAFLHVDKSIALSLLKVTAIQREGGRSVSHVSLSDLC